MSKDPCRPHTGNTQWSMWVCLLTWDCLLHYNFHNMAYKKMFNLVKWGVELKMNWLNWSIPISSGFQFPFNSNSKSFNSIPIQFMLNWIELIINSNSIHELIRALGLNDVRSTLVQVMAWSCQATREYWTTRVKMNCYNLIFDETTETTGTAGQHNITNIIISLVKTMAWQHATTSI